MKSCQTVLVTGYAKAPRGTSIEQIYSYIGVVLEINVETDRVEDAEFTLVTGVAKNFLRDLVVGSNLKHLDVVLNEIRSRYIVPSREAMIIAIQTAVKRYWDTKLK